MGFFSKAKIKSTEIMEQSINFLSQRYDQAASIFSIASPFGQLLAVIANMSELIFSYISHSAEELNIQTAQNHESIFGLSRLTGHDPYRGSSAYGSISIGLNQSANDLMDGNTLIINNFTKLRISETGENYFLNLSSDYIKFELGTSYEPISINITQGEIETQTFTSDGTALQTFNPIVKSMTDHDNVAVTVNGKEWTKVESLYDMPSDDGDGGGECFMVKSSINVGLTIIFGNGNFGAIPPAGSEIIITYIKTAGSSGNVYTSNFNLNFIDSGYDEYGNTVNLNDVLTISTIDSIPPSLGADYESPEFTKMIAPRISKSYVLATPDNYETFLSRYNQFSFVHAHNKKYNLTEDDTMDDDNITYLKIIPNIKKKIGNSMDYFDIPTEEFILSDNEKESISNAIYNSGRQLIGTEVSIDEIKPYRFIINIIIRYFENANMSAIRTDIRNILSKYFLNINRNDIIPLSDLISLIEGVDGVDTCDVFFISEKNETAKKEGGYYKQTKYTKQFKTFFRYDWVDVDVNEEPRVDFDDFGNLIIGENELYIAKGGWVDNDGNRYTETPETGKLGPLNIFFLNKVEYTAYNQNMQKRLTNLLKNNY